MNGDPTKLTRFVCGFAANESDVALIRKNRPEWQAGLLNGIGGHIEGTETGEEAMAREFKEETGYTTLPGWWTLFAILEHWDKSGLVYFYRTNVAPSHAHLIQTPAGSDEPVGWYSMWELEKHEVIDNLLWLIPLANVDQREYWPVRFSDHPEEYKIVERR